MKFLIATLEYFPFRGGIANYYTNLVYYWPKSSEILVLNNNNNELLCRRGLFRWRRAIFSLRKNIEKNKVDHVIIGHILPLGIAMYLVNRFLKTKYSVILHGMDFSFATKNSWKRFLSRLILNRADKIIAGNSYTAKLCSDFLSLEKNNSSSKIKVINPGVKDFSGFHHDKEKEFKPDYIRQRNGLDNQMILFSLGRLVKRKGFDKVISALRIIYKENPNINLLYIIAGKGPAEDYLKRVSQEELGDKFSDRVKFIGEISEKEKWSLFSLSDVFIMPSRNIAGDFEGFGIVYLEANLCQKPVIAGNSGGVPDAVSHEVNGLLVDPENEEEIAQAILKLLSNDFWRHKLGEQGRQRALIKFNWRDQVGGLYEFLKK